MSSVEIESTAPRLPHGSSKRASASKTSPSLRVLDREFPVLFKRDRDDSVAQSPVRERHGLRGFISPQGGADGEKQTCGCGNEWTNHDLRVIWVCGVEMP